MQHSITSSVFCVLLLVILACGVPASATVTTTDNVVPGGAAVHSDPWAVGGKLYVGYSGIGTLSIEAGGEVSNTEGLIGLQSGSTGEVTVTGANSQWNNSKVLEVARYGTATVNVMDGGRVTNTTGSIGYSAGSTGEVTVAGAGSQWNNSNQLRVGRYGNGTLNIEAGGVVSNIADGYIGLNVGSTGVSTVTGQGSEWNNSENLWLGGHASAAGGTGTLNLYDSGLVTVSSTTKLWSTGTFNLNGGNLTTGSFDNSDGGTLNFHDGTLTVNGVSGVFNPGTADFMIDGLAPTDQPELVIAGTATATLSGNLKVGHANQGALTVEAGGVVSNTTSYLGKESGSTGIAAVSGSGSQWNNSSVLYVGHYGNGTLNVTDGGVVSSSAINLIGVKAGSMGQATVTGIGSRWSTTRLDIGEAGNGTLNVESGGVVTDSTGWLGVYDGATGTATVSGSGSQWNNSSVLYVGFQGDGTLNVESAGVVSNTHGYIGRETSSTGEVTVSGGNSEWNNSARLIVGDKGIGTLNVEAAGVVSNTSGYIGEESGSMGEVTVTGTNSQWNNSADLVVGYGGAGTLNVEAGGVVSNTVGAIGSFSGSTGDATVTGTNSQWNNLYILTVGEYGDGTLNVESAGVVSNTHGYIGRESGSTGEVTVSGGNSEWNNSARLIVGDEGIGTLNITDGGVVTNTQGKIGSYAGSTGVATVAGAGSQWNNSDNLYVAANGIGMLNVEAGGKVSNTDGYISFNNSSTGEATVTGTGSEWNNSNNLHVGRDGTGTLNIADNGLVTVGGTTSIGTTATVNLTGGRFQFGETTLEEFNTIGANSGSMAGNLSHTDYTDVSTLTVLQDNAVDLTEVTLTNSGVLYGDASMGNALINTSSGEVEVMPAGRMRFGGSANTNTGEINNFGGQIRFDQDLTNFSGGMIAGRGQFIANGGWTNSGVMFFTGTTDILGDVINGKSGQIVTSASTITTFYDDLEHDGAEIRTSKGSTTIIGGAATGPGAYTGDGTVYFEGDLRPGNSPGTVTFGGDVVLGTTSTTQIELGGLAPGEEYDQLIVRGELSLDGQLMVQLIDGYVPSDGDSFDIFDFGRLAGDFEQLHLPLLSDNLLWNTTGLTVDGILAIETAVTTLAGDFNNDGTVDAADYTLWRDGDSPDSTTAGYALWVDNFGASITSGSGADPVPEPTTLLLALLALVAAPLRVRCG